MNRHLSLLLFIGLGWGQAESNTSEIDYYELGAIAAKKILTHYLIGVWVCVRQVIHY